MGHKNLVTPFRVPYHGRVAVGQANQLAPQQVCPSLGPVLTLPSSVKGRSQVICRLASANGSGVQEWKECVCSVLCCCVSRCHQTLPARCGPPDTFQRPTHTSTTGVYERTDDEVQTRTVLSVLLRVMSAASDISRSWYLHDNRAKRFYEMLWSVCLSLFFVNFFLIAGDSTRGYE